MLIASMDVGVPAATPICNSPLDPPSPLGVLFFLSFPTAVQSSHAYRRATDLVNYSTERAARIHTAVLHEVCSRSRLRLPASPVSRT